jgi:hypothetical protein
MECSFDVLFSQLLMKYYEIRKKNLIELLSICNFNGTP